MQNRARITKNAVANLVRGGAAGVVSIFLPAILVRHMNPIEYSVWVIVIQLAAYSSYLDFGLQTAIGRYVAIAEEKDDPIQRDSIFSTAMVGLAIGCLIAIAALIVTAVNIGRLFPAIPLGVLPPMRVALLIVGSSIALGLPASAWSGIFIGIHRNEFIAAVVGVARLTSAFALILASVRGASLQTMAILVAAINLASYGALYLLANRFSRVRLRLKLVQRAVARDLAGYCFSLMIWSFSTLLVSGLDILLVGRFQLSAIVPYALASSLISFIAGLQSAIFSAMMPQAAVLHSRGESRELGAMVISSTRLAVLLLVLTALPIAIYAGPIFRLWLGQQYVEEGSLLLIVLLIANVIRLSAMPYSVVLVASGQQKLVTLSPLLEGFTNLVASVLLGHKFGAIGVAAGTLLGSVASILGHVVYNMPRTQKVVAFRVRDYLFLAVGIPIIAATPLIALFVYSFRKFSSTPQVFSTAFGISLLLTVAILIHTEGRRKRA